jgi:tetratricopeptide (TPR) repeat protein
MKHLHGVPSNRNVEVVGRDAVAPHAKRLHEEARVAGSRGDYDRALELLDRAHLLAPTWPYPLYDAAFTHLLQGDPVKAEALYAEVDRMAPRGFFTCKTSLDCLRRERQGEVPPGFCKAFALLEWVDKPTKRRALEGIVAKWTTFAAAWWHLVMILEDDDARFHAIEKGLDASPDAETKGMLLINKALILARRGHEESAIEMLHEVADDPDCTMGTEALAKVSLTQILGGDES